MFPYFVDPQDSDLSNRYVEAQSHVSSLFLSFCQHLSCFTRPYTHQESNSPYGPCFRGSSNKDPSRRPVPAGQTKTEQNALIMSNWLISAYGQYVPNVLDENRDRTGWPGLYPGGVAQPKHRDLHCGLYCARTKDFRGVLVLPRGFMDGPACFALDVPFDSCQIFPSLDL